MIFFQEAFTALNSPIVISLILILFILNSITMYDRRILQGITKGALPVDSPIMPSFSTFRQLAYHLKSIITLMKSINSNNISKFDTN